MSIDLVVLLVVAYKSQGLREMAQVAAGVVQHRNASGRRSQPQTQQQQDQWTVMQYEKIGGIEVYVEVRGFFLALFLAMLTGMQL